MTPEAERDARIEGIRKALTPQQRDYLLKRVVNQWLDEHLDDDPNADAVAALARDMWPAQQAAFEAEAEDWPA